MIDKSFTVSIEVSKSTHHVFKCITEDIAKWWGGKDFTGNSRNLNDEFIINHPGAHYSKQKLIEVVQNKKVVWFITEGKLSWLKNQEEWTKTKLIFEIIKKDNSTILHFTHEGLTPDKESYARCSDGWNTVIKNYLFEFITKGKAHFSL